MWEEGPDAALRPRPSRQLRLRKLDGAQEAHLIAVALDALQLVERDFVRVPPIAAPCTGGRSYVRARHIAAVITRLGWTL